MAVRAINVGSFPSTRPQFLSSQDAGAVSIFDRHAAACAAALLDNNRGGAARAFARARLAHCDMAAIQSRCFDAGVSGALLRQAYTLSKGITSEDLSRGNAAVNALAEGAREVAKRERDAKASAPLKVPMFAGLLTR